MAKMLSVRLDFPADKFPVPAEKLPALLMAALLNATDLNKNTKGNEALRRVAMQSKVSVDEYDDRYGGPVFYIP